MAAIKTAHLSHPLTRSGFTRSAATALAMAFELQSQNSGLASRL
jgi:hypothetical protein